MKGDSNIQSFFSRKNVFITGGTGFLGKLLLEKLLRTCPNISMVYLLVREDDENRADKRVEEMWKDNVFNTLRKKHADFKDKVTPIGGNVDFDKLGLTTDDYNLLVEKTDIVFHLAGTTFFEESLSQAIATNVKGTKEVLDLCEKMQNLKCVMFMSSAYAFCPKNFVREHFYDSLYTPEYVLKLPSEMHTRILDRVAKQIMYLWPNVFTFTKAVAENVCMPRMSKLPIGIVRPSAVLPTYKEPLSGWGTSAAACFDVGINVVTYGRSHKKVNIIPADYVVNNMIAAAYDVAMQWEYKQPTNVVFNCVTNYDRTMNNADYLKLTDKTRINAPCRPAFFLGSLLLHFVPAFFTDLQKIVFEKKLREMQLYYQVLKWSMQISYFSKREWNMFNDNSMRLWKEMSKADQEMFPFDLDSIDWKDVMKNCAAGIRAPKLVLGVPPRDKYDQLFMK